MTRTELEQVYISVFDVIIQFEDMLELNKRGFSHGYKKGYVEHKLKCAKSCLIIIEREIVNV